MQETQKGKLIVICGIDGSGKSTQEQYIASFLAERRLKYETTKQPTDWYRNLPPVRLFLDTGQLQCSVETLALLAADRMLHIETVIEPSLANGTYVTCNRYVYSTYASFTVRGADIKFVKAINSYVRKPDLGVLIHVNPSESVKRIAKRDGTNRKFEERDPAYLGSIQNELFRHWPNDFLTVDGMDTEEHIRLKILSYLECHI